MKRWQWIFFLLALCLLLTSCHSASAAPPLRIYFFDVGQGDAVLLRTDEGDILLDAGPEDAQDLLCLRLEQLGVTELTLAIFTHPDEDHIGGADAVLTRIPTREVWTNGAPLAGEAAGRMLDVAKQMGVPVRTPRTGKVVRFGQTVISVLAPLQDVSGAGNEDSIVLKILCGEIGAIFTGDAGIEQEVGLVLTYGESVLDCELYKVGHHGSNTSSGIAFLQSVTPAYAVISCGAANRYGHPYGEVLGRLEDVGATILRTDLLGEIVFETDGETLTYVEHP